MWIDSRFFDPSFPLAASNQWSRMINLLMAHSMKEGGEGVWTRSLWTSLGEHPVSDGNEVRPPSSKEYFARVRSFVESEVNLLGGFRKVLDAEDEQPYNTINQMDLLWVGPEGVLWVEVPHGHRHPMTMVRVALWLPAKNEITNSRLQKVEKFLLSLKKGW